MNKKLKSDLLLIFISISWGLAYPLVRNMLFYTSAASILFLRCLIAVPFILIFYGNKLKNASKDLIKAGFLTGLTMALAMITVLYALNYTTSFNSSVIVGLATPMTALFSALILKKVPDILTTTGVVVCFVGIYILGGGINYKFSFGDFLVMVSNLLFIAQLLLIDKYNKKYDPVALGAIQIITGLFFSFLFWIFSFDYHIAINPTIIYGIAITGTIGLGFAFTFQTIAQKYTSPVHTSLILGLEPIFGVIFSLIIPDAQGNYETVTTIKAIGGLIVIIGVILAEIKPYIKPSFKSTS